QPRQTLRSAASGNKSELDFRLAEFRGLHSDPYGAGHPLYAAAADRKPVDRCNHRLAEILDEIEHPLSEAARLLRLERRHPRELADVSAGNERFAGARQDDAT